MKKTLIIIGSIIGSLIIMVGFLFGAYTFITKDNETSEPTEESTNNDDGGFFTTETHDMGEYDDYFDYEFDINMLMSDIEDSMWYFADLDDEIEFDEDVLHDEYWQEEVEEELSFVRDTAKEYKDIDAPEKFDELDQDIDEAMDLLIDFTNDYPESVENQNMDELRDMGKDIMKAEDLVNDAIEKEEYRNDDIFDTYYYYEFMPY